MELVENQPLIAESKLDTVIRLLEALRQQEVDNQMRADSQRELVRVWSWRWVAVGAGTAI